MPQFTLADFRKDLSPKYKLVPKLESAIRDFDEEWTFTYEPKEPDLFWHPSGDCVPSATELYAKAQEKLHPDEAEVREFKRAMAKFGPVGHFWHQFLQHIMVRYDLCDKDAVERKGWSVFEDVEYGRYRIGENAGFGVPLPFMACVGSADVAPWNFKGHDYIVDFKTMGSRQFQQVTLPESFAIKYECQMNIYMDFFGYDRAIIVAINKDTPHDFKEFEFRRNDALVERIYDKWKFVAECIEHDDPPSDMENAQFDLSPLL